MNPRKKQLQANDIIITKRWFQQKMQKNKKNSNSNSKSNKTKARTKTNYVIYDKAEFSEDGKKVH